MRARIDFDAVLLSHGITREMRIAMTAPLFTNEDVDINQRMQCFSMIIEIVDILDQNKALNKELLTWVLSLKYVSHILAVNRVIHTLRDILQDCVKAKPDFIDTIHTKLLNDEITSTVDCMMALKDHKNIYNVKNICALLDNLRSQSEAEAFANVLCMAESQTDFDTIMQQKDRAMIMGSVALHKKDKWLSKIDPNQLSDEEVHTALKGILDKAVVKAKTAPARTLELCRLFSVNAIRERNACNVLTDQEAPRVIIESLKAKK